jgi:Zn-dependent protease/predicted transcriptional regulator
VLGIDIRLHPTFLLLVAWVAVGRFMHGHDARTSAAAVAYLLAVFAVVLMHELGHALAARRFGIETRDITLLPIGGVSRLEHMPTRPREELVVALAGPLVNLALGAVMFVALVATGGPIGLAGPDLAEGPFLARLMWTNLGLAAFNLLPAFPMDGGRVLRALLARRMDPVRATDVAARVGHAAALVFGIAGLFSNPFLVVIALFVWLGGQQEAKLAHVRWALAGVPVSRAMISNVTCAAQDEPISRVVEHLLGGFQEDIPVLGGGALVGVVRRAEVFAAASARDPDAPVASIMAPPARCVQESDSLDAALEQLQESGRRSLPVVRNGAVVGLLPIENVAYVLQVRERARTAAAHPGT